MKHSTSTVELSSSPAWRRSACSPNSHLLRYAAVVPALLWSCLCFGQMMEADDRRAVPHFLDQGSERPAPPSVHLGSLATLLQGSREARWQMGTRAQEEGVVKGKLRPAPPPPPFQRAWKRGVVELALEGYTAVLIQCQKQQSPAATVALMRADSQQAHCFRF